MDRNVVIATVLIAVILLAWLWLLAPAPTEVNPTEQPITDTTAVAQQQEMPPPEAAEQEEAEPEPTRLDSTVAGATNGEVRIITVDTDLYEARFSTKGATLVSFILKDYTKFDQKTPVQLVDTTTQGAIGLAFTSPQSRNYDTRNFVFAADTDIDTLSFVEEEGSLSFEATVGEGKIRQVYTFKPGEYELGMRVEEDNAASFETAEGYELLWEGGIPFTEGDAEKEAQRAGAYARSGGEVVKIKADSDEYEEQRLAGDVVWTAIKTKYFASVMIPSGSTRGAELEGERVGEGPDVWEDYTARILMPPPDEQPDEFRLYIGPMEFYRITDYDLGLYDIVDYGWLDWLTRPLAKYVFIPVFTLLSKMVPSYGIVIIIFGILIKIVVYPLTKKSYKSMARMRELQPKMEAIKEKYGDNPQKQQQAMMKMYKETGANPLGGCLPMLLQYPIIIALWLFLPQSIEIRQQGFLWAHDLSAPDAILHLPFTLPLYGNFVAGFTLLMGISMIVQMRIQMQPSANSQTKIFTYVMPVMIFAIFNRLASGLSLYYLTYNVVTAFQQKYINAHIEKEKEENGASRNGRRGGKRGDRKRKARRKAGFRKPG